MCSHIYACAKRENNDFPINGSKHTEFKDLKGKQNDLHQDSKFEIT